jgi:HAD superfamily hydrolase (TIGR01549 family)
MGHIKAVIFDFDNTLEDFMTAEAEADARLAKKIEQKFKVPAKDFLARLNILKPRRIHKDNRSEEFSRILWTSEILAWLHVEPDYDIINAAVDEYWEVIMKKAKLFPKTKMILTELQKKYKTGMVSDCDGNPIVKQERLKRIGILPFMDAIVVSDETGYNKPHPDNFKLACKKLGVTAKECVMVGDSPIRDLSSSKKLGMTTVWNKQLITTSISYPFVDYEIKDIGEILELVTKIDADSK